MRQLFRSGMKREKRKPVKHEKLDNYGLARILRKRKPRGGFAALSKYIRLKSMAA
jgi:hypothetical protein